jgi:hypothetical protein
LNGYAHPVRARMRGDAIAQAAKRIVTTASSYGSGYQPARAQDRAAGLAGTGSLIDD